MSNEIIIESIKALKILPDRAEKENQQAEIQITVKNLSRTKNYNVFSSRRRIFYDSNTHTLVIGLSDNEKAYERILKQTTSVRESRHIISEETFPTILTLLPGESRILKVNLPLIIKRIFVNPVNPFIVESSDISDLKKIECIVSYDSASPYKKSKKELRNFRPFESWNFAKKVTITKLGKKVSK